MLHYTYFQNMLQKKKGKWLKIKRVGTTLPLMLGAKICLYFGDKTRQHYPWKWHGWPFGMGREDRSWPQAWHPIILVIDLYYPHSHQKIDSLGWSFAIFLDIILSKIPGYLSRTHLKWMSNSNIFSKVIVTYSTTIC